MSNNPKLQDRLRNHGIDTGQAGPTRTREADRAETDINRIVGKWRETGIVTHVNLRRAVYEDFSNTQSYLDARVALDNAAAIFDSLPARVRARVDNDPGKLIDFVNNPENDDELRELGLKNPIEEEPEPDPTVEPEPPAPAAETEAGE